MNATTVLLTIGLAVLIGLALYKFLSAKKEEKESNVSESVTNPVQENPNLPIEKEPEFLFIYSGDVITRFEKTYKWDYFLKKYVELV